MQADDEKDKYEFAKNFEEEIKEWTQGCTWKGVIDGASKNTFILMGKISNASATIKDFDADNIDALHNECLELGEDIGTFVRVLMGFEP